MLYSEFMKVYFVCTKIMGLGGTKTIFTTQRHHWNIKQDIEAK